MATEISVGKVLPGNTSNIAYLMAEYHMAEYHMAEYHMAEYHMPDFTWWMPQILLFVMTSHGSLWRFRWQVKNMFQFFAETLGPEGQNGFDWTKFFYGEKEI